MRIRSLTPRFGAVLLTIYFGYHLVSGQRGLMAWHEDTQLLAARQAELAMLSDKDADLIKKTTMMQRATVDLDLVEEMARLHLNYSEPGEVVVWLD